MTTHRFDVSLTTGSPFALLKVLEKEFPGLIERVGLDDIRRIALAQSFVSLSGSFDDILDSTAEKIFEEWMEAQRELEDQEARSIRG